MLDSLTTPRTSGCRKDPRQRSRGGHCHQREGGLGPRQPGSLGKRTLSPHHCRAFRLIYDNQREYITSHTSVIPALAGAAWAAGSGGWSTPALPTPSAPPAVESTPAGPRPCLLGLDRIKPPWDGRARTQPAGSRAGAAADPASRSHPDLGVLVGTTCHVDQILPPVDSPLPQTSVLQRRLNLELSLRPEPQRRHAMGPSCWNGCTETMPPRLSRPPAQPCSRGSYWELPVIPL